MIANDLNATVKADLIGFNSAVDGADYIVNGDTTEFDSPVRFYRYSASSTAVADGESILTSTGMGMGRFIKMSLGLTATGIADYTNAATVSGGAGSSVFYLTSDKTATGTALYSTINAVNPIVNDSASNYTYGWTISTDKKTLTVTTKSNTTGLAGLLNVLLPASAVANGTVVNVVVKGN
jgi:hypothetical protein